MRRSKDLKKFSFKLPTSNSLKLGVFLAKNPFYSFHNTTFQTLGNFINHFYPMKSEKILFHKTPISRYVEILRIKQTKHSM